MGYANKNSELNELLELGLFYDRAISYLCHYDSWDQDDAEADRVISRLAEEAGF